MDVQYYINNINIKDAYGVCVSDSNGIVDMPKLKDTAKVSWDNYHGVSIDLQNIYYQPREITLSCFIKASGKQDFVEKANSFVSLFTSKGTKRLVIEITPTKPLIYEVYCPDGISFKKKWDKSLMVGIFSLKLVEPEPVKRVLNFIRLGVSTKTCTITLTTTKLVNIYWGDGSVDYDMSGENLTITHEYAQNGDYFPVITGCIDEISSFTTNAIVVWNKL